jgi:hypothetical protein
LALSSASFSKVWSIAWMGRRVGGCARKADIWSSSSMEADFQTIEILNSNVSKKSKKIP